ncbi:hypothetical protein BDV09DRAFT_163516 [Aspergillus tetrazonus]
MGRAKRGKNVGQGTEGVEAPIYNNGYKILSATKRAAAGPVMTDWIRDLSKPGETAIRFQIQSVLWRTA